MAPTTASSHTLIAITVVFPRCLSRLILRCGSRLRSLLLTSTIAHNCAQNNVKNVPAPPSTAIYSGRMITTSRRGHTG